MRSDRRPVGEGIPRRSRPACPYEAAHTLDLARPTAFRLLGILHYIPDTDEAYAIVRRLMSALAPGSFLVVNHSTSAAHGAAMDEAVRQWNRVGRT